MPNVITYLKQQECQKMHRFRRNSFQQDNTFEKICDDNIATNTQARLSRPSSSLWATETVPKESSNELLGVDSFTLSQGVNYIEKLRIEGSIEDVQVNDGQVVPQKSKSKRSSSKKLASQRRGKNPFMQDVPTHMVAKNVENAKEIREPNNKYSKYTMDDCLTKLSAIPNISIEGMLTVIEAITNCNDNKVILMWLEGKLLRSWIEHIVATHPRFHASSAWV